MTFAVLGMTIGFLLAGILHERWSRRYERIIRAELDVANTAELFIRSARSRGYDDPDTRRWFDMLAKRVDRDEAARMSR